MSRVAAVVLAAGAATRFGSAKQELLLPRVLERLEGAPVDEIVVVEGAHPLREGVLRGRPRLVRCPGWADGPGTSLRCGLAALGDDVEAAVVVLADGPRLAPAALGLMGPGHALWAVRNNKARQALTAPLTQTPAVL